MSHVQRDMFYVLLLLAATRGGCQAGPDDGEQQCDSDRCPKKGAAMLQKKAAVDDSSSEVVKQTAVTRKRGLGFVPGQKGKLSKAKQLCKDAQYLGLGDSWYYTWMARDSQLHQWQKGKTICEVENTVPAAEFVPMVLNCKMVDEIWEDIGYYKEHWSARGSKFLLGYNEPDGMHQTCSPKEGAEKWLTVQKIADAFDPPLRLVSPSPCSGAGAACPGGGVAFGKSPWLTDFFEECKALPECDPDRIEMIGFHDYEGDFDLRPDNIKVRIAGLVANYPLSDGGKRKVWVTEVSPGCGQTSLCRDRKNNNKKTPFYKGGDAGWPKTPETGITNLEHREYLKKILPFFEKSDDVFRYTWYGVRKVSAFNGYPNLLSVEKQWNTVPTPLGQYYKSAPE